MTTFNCAASYRTSNFERNTRVHSPDTKTSRHTKTFRNEKCANPFFTSVLGTFGLSSNYRQGASLSVAPAIGYSGSREFRVNAVTDSNVVHSFPRRKSELATFNHFSMINASTFPRAILRGVVSFVVVARQLGTNKMHSSRRILQESFESTPSPVALNSGVVWVSHPPFSAGPMPHVFPALVHRVFLLHNHSLRKLFVGIIALSALLLRRI